MAAIMAREQLRHEVDGLPEPIAEQVLDFVMFVKARHAEETFLWQQVEATRAYRRRHPEEVMTVTAEEWGAMTAHLENES